MQERIEQLRGYLDPSNQLYQPEAQHINIKAAIALYEDGKLDGLQEVYITNGKVVTLAVALETMTWVWAEVIHSCAPFFSNSSLMDG